jgi:hypothetical protein
MHPRALIAGLLFLASCTSGWAVIVTDPDIKDYWVGKLKSYTQTGPGGPTFTDFTFQASVDLKPGGSLTLATLQGPLLGGAQPLAILSDYAEYKSASFSGEPTTAKGNLNGNFADSTPGNAGTNYRLNLTTGSAAVYSVSLSLAGDRYPATTPLFTLDNGVWSNGLYYLNVGQTTNLGWSFADYNAATDVVVFSIHPKDQGAELVDLQFRGSQPGGYALNGNLLIPGAHYIAQLGFARVVDSPTTIPGVEGFAFYGVETSFEFVAIPEPSTYALLALGLAMVGVSVARRRRA